MLSQSLHGGGIRWHGSSSRSAWSGSARWAPASPRCFARNGLAVVAVEVDEAASSAAAATSRTPPPAPSSGGKLSADEQQALLDRITYAHEPGRAGRRATWSSRPCPSTSTSSGRSSPQLDKICKPEAILATQHLVAVGHRDRRRHRPPGQGRRHALLQPGAGHEAGRGRAQRRHRAGRRRRRRGVRAEARQGRRHDRRPRRLHRQRAAVRLPQPRRLRCTSRATPAARTSTPR